MSLTRLTSGAPDGDKRLPETGKLDRAKEGDYMMQIKDVVEEWPSPPGCWSGFYSHGNRLSPDLKTATIKDVSVIKGDIHLAIVSDGREFSALLNVRDVFYINRIIEVFFNAVGMSLDNAGKLEV